MMKKLIKQLIPACFLFLGAFASCTSENEPDSVVPASGISLRLQTSAGSTRSSVDTGTEAENSIKNVHLWFFASDASDTDKALFYTKKEDLSATGELVLSYTDEVLRLHNMHSEGSYELLVVANLPADAMTIGKATTLDELKNYVYSAASSGRPHNPYTMTGSTTGAHDFSIDSQVSIPLLRVASRLDVKIINATGKTLQVDKVSIVNDQQSVQLFAPASGASAPASNPFEAAADIYTTSITADKVECSGYVYENRSGTPTDVVIEGSVDGIVKTWTAELMPEGSPTLPRNTICEVTLNLKESAPVVPTDIKFSLKGWNTEMLNTEISATFLELNKISLGVEYVLGGVVGVKSDATTIHVDWSKAHGFYLSGHESETEAVVTLTQQNAALLFHFQGEADDIIPDGIITVTAGNLRQQIDVSKIKNNLIFHIKSIEINGHAISEGDIIPADYWGSSKDELIKIVAATNVQWGYRIRGYMPLINSNIIEMDGGSTYNGISGGDSSPDNPMALEMTNIKTAGLEDYLPVYVTMDFFLTTSEPGAEPYKLKTIHFTINN